MVPSLHAALAEEFRELIASGQLRPGDRLPAERDLVHTRQVSRNTVRLAYADLVHQGLIGAVQGSGYRVLESTQLVHLAIAAISPDRPGAGDVWNTEVRRAGHEPTQDFRMRIEPAALRIAARLRIEPGAMLVVREIARYVTIAGTTDPRSWGEETSYYPMDIATECGLDSPTDIVEGCVARMRAHGHAEVGWRDETTVRMPSPAEAQAFDMPAGTPLLDYLQTGATDLRPVRVTRELWPGDRSKIEHRYGDMAGLRLDEPE